MDCTLYLADNCNLECTYCYEGHQKGMDRISKLLQTEHVVIKRILIICMKMGLKFL